VCLRHSKLLCECPAEKHTLRYRYTMEELQALLLKLKTKVETFNNWTSKLQSALTQVGDQRIGEFFSLSLFKSMHIYYAFVMRYLVAFQLGLLIV